MGLSTSHDCWHGSYGAFMAWRTTLAQIAGYPLKRYDDQNGAEGPAIWSIYSGDDPKFSGEWEALPPDPLLILLIHSDADGIIKPEHAQPLADRLEELKPLLPHSDHRGHIGNWRDKTQKFIDGLRTAAELQESVVFH